MSQRLPASLIAPLIVRAPTVLAIVVPLICTAVAMTLAPAALLLSVIAAPVSCRRMTSVAGTAGLTVYPAALGFRVIERSNGLPPAVEPRSKTLGGAPTAVSTTASLAAGLATGFQLPVLLQRELSVPVHVAVCAWVETLKASNTAAATGTRESRTSKRMALPPCQQTAARRLF